MNLNKIDNELNFFMLFYTTVEKFFVDCVNNIGANEFNQEVTFVLIKFQNSLCIYLTNIIKSSVDNFPVERLQFNFSPVHRHANNFRK